MLNQSKHSRSFWLDQVLNFWGWVQMHLLHVVPCSFEKSHRFLPHKIISIKVTLLPFLHHSISKQMALAEASCVCMSVHACDLMHVIKCVCVCTFDNFNLQGRDDCILSETMLGSSASWAACPVMIIRLSHCQFNDAAVQQAHRAHLEFCILLKPTL